MFNRSSANKQKYNNGAANRMMEEEDLVDRRLNGLSLRNGNGQGQINSKINNAENELDNNDPIFQQFDFNKIHQNFKNDVYKQPYKLDEKDVIMDPDNAIIENEMTKILVDNSTCPICLGVCKLSSAILCSTCGSNVCEDPCFEQMPDPRNCPQCRGALLPQFKTPPVMRLMMEQVHFKCPAKFENCNQARDLPHDKHFKHLKNDHGLHQKLLCPLGCGDKLNYTQLKTHLLLLNQEQNFATIIKMQEYCKEASAKCNKCKRLVYAKHILHHECSNDRGMWDGDRDDDFAEAGFQPQAVMEESKNPFGADTQKSDICNAIQELYESNPYIESHKPRKTAVEKWKELGPLNVTKLALENFFRIELSTLGIPDLKYNPIQYGFKDRTIGKGRLFFGQANDQDQPQGIVRAIDDNYGIYEGQFENGNFNGFGRYIYYDGEYYIGWFLGGAKHGFGKLVYDDGKVRIGNFNAGSYIGMTAKAIQKFKEEDFLMKKDYN